MSELTPSERLALSTWSVHRALGIAFPETPASGAGRAAEPRWGDGDLPLLELPAKLAGAGIARLEICHFHLPRHEPAYLDELKAAIAGAGVTLQTLLIDDGDITDPVHGTRDLAWIGAWIDVAGALGAEKARVIAGRQSPDATVLDRSVAGLHELAARADAAGVRLLTENWHETTAGPAEVLAIMERLDDRVGLLADFGNWTGAGKYDDLARILPLAENTHAKCAFGKGLDLDSRDYGRCLDLATKSGFDGPHTLIYEGEHPDEWAAIALIRDLVLTRIGSAAAPTAA